MFLVVLFFFFCSIWLEIKKNFACGFLMCSSPFLWLRKFLFRMLAEGKMEALLTQLPAVDGQGLLTSVSIIMF